MVLESIEMTVFLQEWDTGMTVFLQEWNIFNKITCYGRTH
jgi:hypothetical protein